MESSNNGALGEVMVSRLSALAQTTRLRVFRLLVRVGAEGIRAKDIAQALQVPANTLSTHLRILGDAGLVTMRPAVRERYFSVRFDAMEGLLAYLVEDCCQGRSEVCAPLAELIANVGCCGVATASDDPASRPGAAT